MAKNIPQTNAAIHSIERSSLHLVLLLGHTHSFTFVTGRCGVLSANSKTPIMSKSTMSFDLLQPLQIFTELVFQTISQDLRGLSIFDILRSVEIVIWDLVLSWILHDSDKPFHLFIRQFTSSFVHVDVSFLQADVGESSSDSFNGSHGVHDFGFSINVCVHHTKNVLELVGNDERHLDGDWIARSVLISVTICSLIF